MSLIDTQNINENFPIQGQDNPSQGFRSNFAYIKLALNVAAAEITDLQSQSQQLILGFGSGIALNNGVLSITTASSNVLGGIIVGDSLTITGQGLVNISSATTTSLGGVIVGDTLYADGSGTVNINPATTGTVGGVIIGKNISLAENGTISLSTATAGVLGLVKIGANIQSAGDGTISVADPYVLPFASSSTLGGVRIGSNISINGGVISVAAPYVLPTASSSVLGGVKIGANVSKALDGTISVADPYVLPVANLTRLGGVKIGNNINTTPDGTISVAAPYTLPAATTSSLGGVVVGSGISINTATNAISVVTFDQSLNTTDTVSFQSLNVAGNTRFSGPVTFSGTATYVYSTNTVYTDNILELHSPNTPSGAWASDDAKDIGLRLRYYKQGDKNAALVMNASARSLEWYVDTAAGSDSAVSGTYGTFKTGSVILTVDTSTNSSSTVALGITSGTISFSDNTIQGTRAPKFWTSVDLDQGLFTLEDLRPGDYFYDDGTQSPDLIPRVYLYIDRGHGAYDFYDLTR
jgi:hypothetical protein